jgi:hypothetical protein
MNSQMALLSTRQIVEADRLSVVSGLSTIELMDNAGTAVGREIGRRWKARPVIVLCGRVRARSWAPSRRGETVVADIGTPPSTLDQIGRTRDASFAPGST